MIRAAFLSDFGPTRLDSAFDVQFFAHRPTLRHALDGWFACGGGTCHILPADELADLDVEVEVVCYPELAEHAADRHAWHEQQLRMFAWCELAGDRMAIVDTPPGLTVPEVRDWRTTESGADTAYGALYYPWIRVAGPSGELVTVPPCGHVAGTMARLDAERGPAHAPANVALEGVLDVAVDLTGYELEILIPVGINPLRAMSGWGIRPWAARTLSSERAERSITTMRLLATIRNLLVVGIEAWQAVEPLRGVRGLSEVEQLDDREIRVRMPDAVVRLIFGPDGWLLRFEDT